MPEQLRDELVLSYYRVRQALGWLGLSLPFVLILGGMVSLGGMEPSISDYYHTLLRDLFVGIMTAIAIFLIAYPGHRRQSGEAISDDSVTTLAGIAALGVAFFPNEGPAGSAVSSVSQAMLGNVGAATGHYASAIVFLLCLASIGLVKVARTAKPYRRKIYRSCGWLILVMAGLVILASWFKIRGPAAPQAIVNDLRLVLWLEAIAVWAFALSWLTKGRADLALARPLRRRHGVATEEDEATA
jgi:hypothetical protein